MSGQLLATVIGIGIAGAYLLSRGWRAWRGLKGGACAGGCGCSKATPAETQPAVVLIPPEQLTMRPR